MARSYQEIQPANPAAREVVWQQRPRARQIPVQFVTVPQPKADPPRSTAAELTWLPRHEQPDPKGQS
ncbi:MAG: hypothetical protein HZA92_10940 [Verrucomicrobia bacterium]|nr:hypothetical protein [Verrucomicrobiota bacterium]